jgi:hypothetical protein
MRWICRQLVELQQNAENPSLSDAIIKAGYLVGGFVFLRFFCPVVVAPETINIVRDPNVRTRRNLILIAKVLQNLANGVPAHGAQKEDYMRVCDPFIREHSPRNLAYVKALVDIVPERHQADCTGLRESTIQVTMRQAIEVVSLCRQHLEILVRLQYRVKEPVGMCEPVG